jgi:hypothetical protein
MGKLENEMIEQREKGEETSKQIQKIFDLLQQLFKPLAPPTKSKSTIGFKTTS